MRAGVCAPALGALGALALGCAGPAAPRAVAPRSEGAATQLRYVVAVADDLAALDVEACFAGALPEKLVCGVRGGGRLLRSAELLSASGGAARPLPHDASGIDLRKVAPGACIRYRVELEDEGLLGFEMRRMRRAVVSNPAAWLWRSPLGWRGLRATARFDLGDGVDVAVPWPATGEERSLDESAFGFAGHVVFGRFERERFDAAGMVFDLVVLDGLSPPTRTVLADWVATAARATALVGGHAPVERVQIVVVPVPPGSGSEPVRFGHVTRGGGASVVLFVESNATREMLVADWTLPHELSHLWRPFVERSYAWLSEGLATYYQEVVRARAGLIPRAVAWQKLRDGAELGRDAEGTLAEASARVFESFEFKRVYWGGAAIALLADVEIRRRSGGERSLDDVMRALAACCARDPRRWSGEALVARMDEIAGSPVFAGLVARHVNGASQAELGPTYERLGLAPSDEGFLSVAGAPEAWIREAIMGEGSSIASQR